MKTRHVVFSALNRVYLVEGRDRRLAPGIQAVRRAWELDSANALPFASRGDAEGFVAAEFSDVIREQLEVSVVEERGSVCFSTSGN